MIHDDFDLLDTVYGMWAEIDVVIDWGTFLHSRKDYISCIPFENLRFQNPWRFKNRIGDIIIVNIMPDLWFPTSWWLFPLLSYFSTICPTFWLKVKFLLLSYFFITFSMILSPIKIKTNPTQNQVQNSWLLSLKNGLSFLCLTL